METKIIGGKIAEARKKISLSQAELAQRLFISPQAVGKWERGESFPDIITFIRLAEILGVDLNYFSENFKSVIAESDSYRMTSDELFNKPSDVLSSKEQNLSAGKAENKLRWDLSRGNWLDADFSGLKNLQEKFNSSNMQRCKFIGSELSGLLLKSNNINSCDFSGSDVSSSQIQTSNLFNTLFKDCSLKETEFSASYIMNCDFSGANFTGAIFKSGGFQNNLMTNTVLNRTSFNSTQLVDIVFDGTLEDCYFENCDFKKVRFQNSTLINTFFKCKSLKKIEFIDCQSDRMTYEFLKNGKADLSGITLII